MNSDQNPSDLIKELPQRLDVDFALQTMGLGVWELNTTTNQVIWDDQCRQLFGLVKDNELPYEQVIQYIHPQDVERVDQAVRWALDPQSDGVYDQTYRTIGAVDGQLRWVHFRGKSYFSPTGELTRFAGFAQEVTQQVVAQQKRADTESRFRSLIEEAPVATSLYVGRELRIEVANDSMISFWGKGPSVLGQPLALALPELEGQPFLDLLDQVFTTGEAYTNQGMRADLMVNGVLTTRYFDFTYKPLRNSEGEVYAIMNMATDVTQQVLARQALDQQQAQQRFLLLLSDSLRSLNDPLTVYYQTACLLGTYLGANRVGYAEDQGDGDTIVVLRNYVDGVDDLQGTYHYADYGPLLAEFQAGHTVVRPDIAHDPTLTIDQKEAHRVLQLGATVNKPLMKDGRLVAVLFIHYQQAHHWSTDELNLLDMVAERLMLAVDRALSEAALRQSETRYRQLSAELEQLVQHRTQELAAANEELTTTNDELAESNSLLNRSNDHLQQFAYVASHDLQEPLRKIQQFGALLKAAQSRLSGDELMYLERMQSAASRMATLIQDLLTFARFSNQGNRDEQVSLNEVVEQVLSTLELVIADTNADVVVDPLPVVRGDASQLAQLFQNLVGNALKFHRPSITPVIYIRAQTLEASELPLSIKPPQMASAYYQIDVADNGVGFDEQYLDRIFQVFQRLHGKSAYGGTGIGLAICERVVANHGGSITAHSQPGQGATFTVYLPV